MRVRDSVCKPFKRSPGFPAAFHFTGMDGILAYFHRQMLWELLFLALVLQAGKPGLGLRLLSALGGYLQSKYFSQFLTTTCECRPNLFQVSIPSVSFEVASLYFFL